MKPDIKSRAEIELMVNTFYERAREHPELGPIFNDKIGELWSLHLDTMYRFWETLLLDNRQYFGSPFPKHANLPLKREHFDQWIVLFTNTIDDLFEGAGAEDAKKRARTLAITFQSKYVHLHPEA